MTILSVIAGLMAILAVYIWLDGPAENQPMPDYGNQNRRAEQAKSRVQRQSRDQFAEQTTPFAGMAVWGNTIQDFDHWWQVIGDHKVATTFDQYLVNVAGQPVTEADRERLVDYSIARSDPIEWPNYE